MHPHPDHLAAVLSDTRSVVAASTLGSAGTIACVLPGGDAERTGTARTKG